MSYDHGNYDYSHGLLPKTHFREKWYNVPNAGAMEPIERPKDRHGYDRSKFTPKRKMSPYGNGGAIFRSNRKQHRSTAMRRHYLSERKTSKRFRLRREMIEILSEMYDC